MPLLQLTSLCSEHTFLLLQMLGNKRKAYRIATELEHHLMRDAPSEQSATGNSEVGELSFSTYDADRRGVVTRTFAPCLDKSCAQWINTPARQPQAGVQCWLSNFSEIQTSGIDTQS